MTIKEGCPLCSNDLVGSKNIKYLCRKCNVLFEMHNSGLYIGRFQPFHNGHLKIIKDALEEVDSITIVVAMPLKKTEDDLFSEKQRAEMIDKALKDEGIRKYKIIALKDIPSDAEYVKHVRDHVPPFNAVYVGDNALNEKLFREAGFRVIASDRHFGLSATGIRQLMKKKKDSEWKRLVPKAVYEYIKRIE